MNMKLFPLICGHLQCRKRIFLPYADKEQTVSIPIVAFLIQHPDGNVLVDTGPNPHVYDDPYSIWGNLAKSFKLIADKGEDILSQLTLQRNFCF